MAEYIERQAVLDALQAPEQAGGDYMPKTRLIDLTGQRFGRLVVLERTGTYKGSDGSGSSPIWKCQCDCGEVVEVIGRNLRHGGTKSCGCIRRDKCRRSGTPGE